MVPGTKAPLPAGRALAAPRPATSRSPRAALAPAARAPDPAAPAPVRGPSSPPPPALPPSSSRPGRADVAAAIRTIPDFPKRGVRFFDVSTLCLDPRAFRCCIDLIAERYRGAGVQCVAGFEARGFIFGPPVALALGVPFVMIRKAGKLPGEVVREEYATEYSKDAVEMHRGAVAPGQRVLLVDDLVATGGTLLAGANLIRRAGGEVVEAAAVIELPELGGRRRLEAGGLPLFTLLGGAEE